MSKIIVSLTEVTGENGKDKVRCIIEKLEQGIKELFASEQYAKYLRTMSRFTNYSLNNSILIFFQMPTASHVAGFKDWQKKFHRNVKKGEKGIKILAPMPYKRTVEKENEDGSKSEETEIVVSSFKIAHVFDVSQTEGEDLPTIGVNELTGDVEQYQKFFDALMSICPCPVAFEDIETGAHGYYHLLERRVAIQRDMSQLQTLKTCVHEIAHAVLHHLDENDKRPTDCPDQRTREIQAESVAYTVCQHFGLDTSDYSFAYVAGWSSGKETPELKKSLDVIHDTAHKLITDIENFMKE